MTATACIIASGNTLTAQTTGTVDAGASWVDYEGFLGSGALYVTPTLRYNTTDVSLGASGSYVLFESSNRILQGLAAGAWRTRLTGRLRAELSASAGINVYANYPGYGHLLGRARLHYGRATSGMWAGAASGQSYIGSASTTPLQLELGGWTVYRGLALNATVMRSWFADTAYVDLLGAALWHNGSLRIDGSLGLRTWSEGGGQGIYGELHILLPVHDLIAAQVAGGRYPSDPIRGVIAANYVSIGVRIEAFNTRGATPSVEPSMYSRETEGSEALAPGEASLTVRSSSRLNRIICVAAPGAESVELSGDFTDWRALPLSRTSPECWEITVPIPSGAYRVNVRLDGGRWVVPRGLRIEDDEFGGRVGILVIP
ncbi:MAG: glycogen-binding domain-containing protein [Gemmatimonadota bacterium]|nr:MAG: glycogen-binding domain-containing protein [Gemmatimonadota bacterium]